MTHGSPPPDAPRPMPAQVPTHGAPRGPGHAPTLPAFVPGALPSPVPGPVAGHVPTQPAVAAAPAPAPVPAPSAYVPSHATLPALPVDPVEGQAPALPGQVPGAMPGPVPPGMPGPDPLLPLGPGAASGPRPPFAVPSLETVKAYAMRYGRVLWWFHSFYALGLGIFIIIYAQKGFAHARWLSISLAGAWIVLLLFFRLFGSGKERALEGRRDKLRFFVMTYVLKNLYQGMLFFLLPFYWRSATLDTPNQWFVLLLAVCAGLSTLDVVFDNVLMRWKVAASIFYFVTLFACLNLVIPALLPNMRSLVTMTAAAAISALAFWVMHVPTRYLARPGVVAGLVAWTLAAVLAAYFGRAGVPPVSMYVAYGAVGPDLLSDGRLSIEASKLHHSLIHELYAVTDVMTPGGKGDHLMHVWIHEGKEVDRTLDLTARTDGPPGTVRLRSQLDSDALVDDPVGSWTVDVVTIDGQLVGRAAFEITQ